MSQDVKSALIVIPVALVLIIMAVLFLRALTAKLLTGKWPHQSREAQDIYRNLP